MEVEVEMEAGEEQGSYSKRLLLPPSVLLFAAAAVFTLLGLHLHLHLHLHLQALRASQSKSRVANWQASRMTCCDFLSSTYG